MGVPAAAQAPEIGGLLPAGGLRGQVTHVRIDGKNLKGALLHLDDNTIAIKSLQVAANGESLTADFVVQSGANLGPHELRITTPKGVSNGSRFWVDVVPNRVLEQPMQEGTPPVPLDGAAPIVINSRIAAKAGRDRFVLTASAGEHWVFDCFADRIRSRFDPVMELADAEGISLKLVQSTWESDPRFCYQFAKSGRYFLTVRDSEYNGGSNYTYRLLVGRMPFVTGYSPRGERPGHPAHLALQGIGLPETNAVLSIPPNAAPGVFWAEAPSGSAYPEIIPLLVDSEPVYNMGDSEVVRPLPALPFAADGVFAHTPRARFAFHAVKKQKILFDLLGRRIGSRIDGEIRVLDSNGKEVADNDDAPGLGKDARLEFAPPADGEYTLEVRNVEEVVGQDCYYRLLASVVVPDFEAAIEIDRLAVPQGGKMTIPVHVERVGGFNGPVEVRVEGLPKGVSCSGGTIPEGKPSVDITLTAAPDAVVNASEVHILGKATIGGKVLEREAPAWERYEHRSIDLVLSVEYSYTRPHHLWKQLFLAVTEAPPPKK